MFDVLAGLALEFLVENSPKAKKVVDKVMDVVDDQTKPTKKRYDMAEKRFSTMSDERLIEYAKRNKDRLKSDVEGLAIVKELQNRGLTHRV